MKKETVFGMVYFVLHGVTNSVSDVSDRERRRIPLDYIKW